MTPVSLLAGNQASLSPLALLRSLRHHRSLWWQLVRRDVASRYQGSLLGLVWSLITPLLMLGIYLFVFGFVFNPLRGGGSSGAIDFSSFGLSLFAGMLVHGLLADCLIRSAHAVVSQPSYVKKIVFPVELLPLTVLGSALVQYLIGVVILLAATWAVQGLSPSLLLWPLVLAPLLVLCAGVSLAVAALAVYLRDIAQITGLGATVLMFLSPVFYPLDRLPPRLQVWMQANPITFPIEASRSLLRGVAPDWGAWALYSLCSLGVLWLGWAAFQGLRRGFADVL